MSEVKVNKITPTADCGTVTLGDSGDTVAIAAGATVSAPSANVTNSGTVNSTTITNSGALTNSGTITNTGTISGGTITGNIDGQVSWQTTVKTANFTATAGEGYFVNTTSGAITVTLPASPSAGDIVGVKDYANTADTNGITINRNGENIQGDAANYLINTEGLAIVLLYVDSTKGWLSIGQAKASDIVAPLFISATGGTITTSGNFKIHTFTSPGTFTVTQLGNAPTVPSGGPTNVDYLVVAGGGGGGAASNKGSGGGGAGGQRSTFPSPSCNAGAFPVTAQAYPITVGGGGAGGADPSTGPVDARGTSGSNSIFSTITSSGGGGGGASDGNQPGLSGGSGGGGGSNGPTDGSGGSGNSPPVSPSQGNNAGSGGGGNASHAAGGGGGGSGATGSSASGGCGSAQAGDGGNGSANSITGSPVTRSGGGGGSAGDSAPKRGGTGGTGGGGNGQYSPTTPSGGGAGTANTGGGGGAGHYCNGGAGGSGVVIIRYKYQ